MARAGNIPEDIVAGAILAGAYFGDRNGPLSSSASLVAALTHTKVPTNIPIMFKDGLPALCDFYCALSITISVVPTQLY